MKHLDIRVRGKVQGVFFRDSARREAERLGITGFAKNEPDGTVYIETEGSEELLDEFLDWCREGSGPANVTNVEVESKTEQLKNYQNFTTY